MMNEGSSSPKTWEEAVLWLKSQPGCQDLVKACFFDDPLLEAAKRFYESLEWQRSREFLIPKDNRNALDLGAGRGISSYALAKDGWHVIAVEPDSSEIVGAGAIRNLANTTELNIEVVRSCGETLPFADESFDLVYCRQALHHASDLNMLCKELGRVLTKGGIFFAAREHVISKKSDIEEFWEKHPLHKYYGGEMAYRLDEYRKAIRGGGIKIDRELNPFESDINLYPQTIVMIKHRIAEKLGLVNWRFIPTWFVKFLGAVVRSPGRLYTFIGHKI